MTETELQKSAKWIWYVRHSYDNINRFMQARRMVALKEVPESAPICITADAKYRLYVNGKHVHRGPARGFQNSWPFDRIDIAPYLRTGENIIAAEVHSLGIGTYSYIHSGYSGFLLWGEIGGTVISTNKEWKVRKAPGQIRTLTRTSIQLNFQEYFDAREDDGSWLCSGFDDSEWKQPEMFNFGSMPWHSLEERGIPLLGEKNLSPESIVSTACGDSAENYRGHNDFVKLFTSEKREWHSYNKPLQRTTERLEFTCSASGEGRFKSFCIDFGHEVVGSARLNIDGADGGEIVDYAVCEQVDRNRPVILDPEKNICSCAFGSRLILRKGNTVYEQYDHWGFRYLIITVRDTKTDLNFAVSLRWAGYPLDIRGEFNSSDETLNKIYKMSVLTQQCCMLDAYVDCPWREQAQWWGDARVQAANTFYLAADHRLFKRGIRQIGTQEVKNGLSFGHTPTIGYNCILPDFTLTWIITHWDYYWQTGDLALFSEMKDRIHRAFDYFEDITGETGLIPHDDRYWLFLDWCGIFREGYPALYNMFYLLALRYAAHLFFLSGDKKQADIYSNREAALFSAIRKQLWDQKAKTYFAGLTWKKEPVRQEAPHILAFSLLLDIVPQKYVAQTEESLVQFVRGKREEDIVPSPYFMYYIFEALKKAGKFEDIISCIKRWWGEMLDENLSTTKEVWEPLPGDHSLCHAWSAHPIIHLSNILLGINQAEPNWHTVKFSPQINLIDSASGKVATPNGIIEVAWRKKGRSAEISLSVPSDISVSVDIGAFRKQVRGGNYRWSVSIP